MSLNDNNNSRDSHNPPSREQNFMNTMFYYHENKIIHNPKKPCPFCADETLFGITQARKEDEKNRILLEAEKKKEKEAKEAKKQAALANYAKNIENAANLAMYNQATSSGCNPPVIRYILAITNCYLSTRDIPVDTSDLGSLVISSMVSISDDSKLPPRKHEVALLYVMLYDKFYDKLMDTTCHQPHRLELYSDYGLNNSKTAKIIWSWRKIVKTYRDEKSLPRMPLSVGVPDKSSITLRNACVKFNHRVCDDLGFPLEENPYESAYNGTDTLDRAKHLQPEMPSEYMAKFTNRELASNLTLEDHGVLMVESENFGVLSALIEKTAVVNHDLGTEIIRSMRDEFYNCGSIIVDLVEKKVRIPDITAVIRNLNARDLIKVLKTDLNYWYYPEDIAAGFIQRCDTYWFDRGLFTEILNVCENKCAYRKDRKRIPEDKRNEKNTRKIAFLEIFLEYSKNSVYKNYKYLQDAIDAAETKLENLTMSEAVGKFITTTIEIKRAPEFYFGLSVPEIKARLKPTVERLTEYFCQMTSEEQEKYRTKYELYLGVL